MTITPDLAVGQRPKGVTSIVRLPQPGWEDRWERIVVPDSVKRRLLNFTLFCLGGRKPIPWVALPTHGIVLLAGPPGTGKTTLGQGLANAVACRMADSVGGHVTLVVTDPHALPSELLGASQQAAARLFDRTLPDIASDGYPVVVLLDEVEGLAVSRWQASSGANPVDVQRVTEAVLTGIDRIAQEHRNIVFVATTNHLSAVDPAFVSRADLVEEIGLPGAEAIELIVRDSLLELCGDVPPDDGALGDIARRSAEQGYDARQVRKLALRAIVADDELAAGTGPIDAPTLIRALASQVLADDCGEYLAAAGNAVRDVP
jgi:SpoVK/Ycf46/Vps4 family AAA+-type ATPase